MSAALYYDDARSTTQRFVLSADRVSIGRHPSNDLVFPTGVSGKHCLLERRRGAWAVVDLGSDNGTFVNDERVEGIHPLEFGDQLRIGEVHARFVEEDPEAAATFSGAPIVPKSLFPPITGDEAPLGPSPIATSLREIEDSLAEVAAFLRSLPESARAPHGALRRALTRAGQVSTSIDQIERNQVLAQTLAEVGKLMHLLAGLDNILGVTLDLAVRALGADRGFILFGGDDETLEVKVSRNMGDPRGISRTIAEMVVATGKPVVTSNAQLDPRYSRTESVNLHAVRAVMCVPLRARDTKPIGAIYVDGNTATRLFNTEGISFLSVFASHAANAVEAAQIKEKSELEEARRKRLSRYFSESVISHIIDGNPEEALRREARVVTLLFTDIRGFTSLLERLSPAEAVEMLNDYYSEIVEELQAEEGTLDKFTGDGLMAFWGAPKEQADHALRAVRAALKMQARVPALVARWKREGRSFARELDSLPTGIGINTGEAVIGDIGSPKRLEYTAIGDAVNLTARVQGQAKGGEVLITGSTLEIIRDRVRVEALPPVQVKGKSAPVPLFRVLDVL